MPSQLQQQGLANYILLFNQPKQSNNQLIDCVANDIEFQDPFVRLQGKGALESYLAHFATQVIDPSFERVFCGWDGNICLLRWNFSGGLKSPGDWCFAGVSELHFDDAGRVVKHLDFWDSGKHFYRRLPLLGMLIRWVERRLSIRTKHISE